MPPVFEPGRDVQAAGVLFAVPALLVNGLLQFSDKYFKPLKGYYSLNSLLLILPFMALLRIRSLERIRYWDPGELGKLVGLDRVPEVRTLRRKVQRLVGKGDAPGWSQELSRHWMQEDPERAGTLYVDGHVRVYYGKQTKLPKRYVAREKLCLRGITDYWINDALGQPFFVISKTVTAGLLQELRQEIVPRLVEEVPHQPSVKELEADPYRYRFELVFDREGYSPAFFQQMWQQRIACITYRKYVQQAWNESEFEEVEVRYPNQEVGRMKLAERGLYLPAGQIWMREIRKLSPSGHQTALVTTNYTSERGQIAAGMFSRWSQENFFKYMMQHYGIDRLADYQLEGIDETVQVVNPAWRQLDSKLRSQRGKLVRKRAEYGALLLEEEIEEENVQKYAQQKAELREAITDLQAQIEALKAQRKETNQHISFRDLPEAEQFKSFKPSKKQFLDTLKMIAYRAETALVTRLRTHLSKKDEARALVRQILHTDADLEPDLEKGILKVRLHNLANPRNHKYVQLLCDSLNATDIHFPGTNLRLVYDLVANQNPADQEV
ncbi:hypothetical protein MYX65_08305 [Acidobacteria bacterium AH-259-L09]|nr:hypothetical protein [Acidobacteria bacterium AH-259-L09]